MCGVLTAGWFNSSLRYRVLYHSAHLHIYTLEIKVWPNSHISLCLLLFQISFLVYNEDLILALSIWGQLLFYISHNTSFARSVLRVVLWFCSVYCPAGCKNVTGDVWGNSEQGYRDVSTLHIIRPRWFKPFIGWGSCLKVALFSSAADISPVQVGCPCWSCSWSSRRSCHRDPWEKPNTLRSHFFQWCPL